jgi:cell division protein FtsZ
MGIGYGTGEGRSLQAARNAISSPLLEASIEGARGILLTIAGGSDLGLFEVNEAAEVIHGVTHPDANIIFGSIIDDEMGEEVRVTVIAAGFDRWDDREVTSSSPSTSRSRTPTSSSTSSLSSVPSSRPLDDVDFSSRRSRNLDDLDSDDEFDVPSFLK